MRSPVISTEAELGKPSFKLLSRLFSNACRATPCKTAQRNDGSSLRAASENRERLLARAPHSCRSNPILLAFVAVSCFSREAFPQRYASLHSDDSERRRW